ncbi:G-type lectin S-receptor-like serine/threonine-protein kinase [Dichanthelium oligosanthes]|uniref:Receptor-like serine/threonine-protein kinase n=1 Tax=Dichanthelium oligosanthes TaxID=888268 RepID=A0A1E5VY77_9POAL|nr:G-type lectin S-receptor-like serine/threonine-protein kinase [Dichanthelium oligosanthes]
MATTITTTLDPGVLHYMLVILLLSLQGSPAGARDVITATQPLSGLQKLVSQGGKFALGFYRPGGGLQDKWYIAIWYNKVQKVTPVWIANRETPISDPFSSVLTISTNGNLALLNKNSRSIVWSSNTTSTTAGASNTTIVAVLLNTGNLVLAYASNTSIMTWQSFNHPTDTQLPGMRFGRRNKLTGESDRLVSWRDHMDPSPGIFSDEMDTSVGAQFVLRWNNSRPYFTSGKFNPQTGAFAGIPSMTVMSRPNSIYSYEYVDNDKEEYFLLTVMDDSIFLRTVIDPSGQLKGMVWLEEKQDWMVYFVEPSDVCSVYSACGAFSWCAVDNVPVCSCLRGFTPQSQAEWSSGNYTGGCTRKVALPCSLSTPSMSSRYEEDRFYEINNVSLPDGPQATVQAANISDCEVACLNKCSCLAYSYNGTCSLWYSDLMNLQADLDNTGNNSIFIRLPASEIPRPKSTRGQTKGVAIAVSALALGVLCLVAVLCVLRRRRSRIKGLYNNINMTLMAFRYKDLQLITKNFSDKLGTGSFGSVFKGVLQDGTTVAIKKLEGVRQGEKQFRAEISTIGNIHHVNLIQLLGFCSEGEHRLLVYEYMPHGSLDGCLFKVISSDDVLPWNTRYQIAIGIAKGLTYLHEKCRDCIIHCDIKPQNILLDASFVPKVSDFGLAKLLGRDFSRVMTTMRGTIGYLAPEWISGMAITAKSDVFSYGMMLLEIISQKRNVELGKPCMDKFFPILVLEKIQEGDVRALLDAADMRRDDVNLEELERACMVACWCIQEHESSRPTMEEVVQMLEGLRQVDMPPVPRYLRVVAESATDQSSTLLDEMAAA